MFEKRVSIVRTSAARKSYIVGMQHKHPTEEKPPRYPSQYAFVVQFQDKPGNGDGRPGRVEHVQSGTASRFRNSAQLIEFVSELLASLDRLR